MFSGHTQEKKTCLELKTTPENCPDFPDWSIGAARSGPKSVACQGIRIRGNLTVTLVVVVVAVDDGVVVDDFVVVVVVDYDDDDDDYGDDNDDDDDGDDDECCVPGSGAVLQRDQDPGGGHPRGGVRAGAQAELQTRHQAGAQAGLRPGNDNHDFFITLLLIMTPFVLVGVC